MGVQSAGSVISSASLKKEPAYEIPAFTSSRRAAKLSAQRRIYGSSSVPRPVMPLSAVHPCGLTVILAQQFSGILEGLAGSSA